MKKILLLILSVITVSLASAISFNDPVIANVKLTDTYLINLKYTEEKIAQTELQQKRELTAKEKDSVLDSIINIELIKQAAKRDGIVVTEEMLIQMLNQQVGGKATTEQIIQSVEAQYGQPWDTVSVAIIEQLTVQEYIKKAGADDLKKLVTPTTENEITNFYNANKTKFVNPDMVRVNHVFFSTQGKSGSDITSIKKKADDAMLELKQGKTTFDDLVQNVSDDRNSAKNGGELGFITMDEQNTVDLLGSDFITKVMDLPMGSVHGVLKSTAGYHIVIITEKRSAKFLKLTDAISPASAGTVHEFIEANIQQSKLAEASTKITNIVLDRIKSEAKIKIIDKSIPWK